MNIEIDWLNTYLVILGIVALIFTIPTRNFLITKMPELLKTTEIISPIIYFGSFLIAAVVLLSLSLIGLTILAIIQEIQQGNFFFLKITNKKRQRK